MLPIGGERRLRFVAVVFGQLSFLGSLHGKPQACVYLVTWRAGPEPQWRDENKSRGHTDRELTLSTMAYAPGLPPRAHRCMWRAPGWRTGSHFAGKHSSEACRRRAHAP